MATFTYTAVGKNKKTLTATIESATIESAKAYLQKQGITPLVIKPITRSKGGLFGHSKKVKTRDMVIFTRQLSTMINAGVPLVRSLATLQAQTESQTMREELLGVQKDIEGGMAFADALGKHPKTFSDIYVNMVRAGEAGGILDDILKKLALQQEKDAKIKGKFKSAMTYPAVLLTVTFSVFIGLMTVAIPKIGKTIQELVGPDKPMPILTRYMLAISHFMTSEWYILVGGTAVVVYFTKRYVKTPAGRRNKDLVLLKIPVLKTIIIKVAVARFSRIFASLMGAGVSVLDAISTTGKAVGNSIVEEELAAAAKDVANGQQLSAPLAKSKIFPPIVSQMLAVGEETGQIDQILVKVADFYEEEVDVLVDSMSSILEPVMIVIMGGMVALIALSVIGPITNIANQI